MEYLNITQIADILRAAYESSRRDHLLLLLSFQHGLRAREVSTLRLTDVADGHIHVERVKNSLETTQPLLQNKNPLFNESLALAAWLKERKSDSIFLFTSQKGSGLDSDSVSRVARQYMRQVGIPAKLAHHHSLKHAIASLMIRSGKGLELVKQQLGHRAISSTIHYVHTTDSEATAAAQDAIQQAVAQS